MKRINFQLPTATFFVASTSMLYSEFTAMNTHILLAAQGAAERVAQGFEKTREYIAAREVQFTRFQETSELMQLNRAAGTWFNASPELFDVVQQAYELHYQTESLFDPSILNALEHAGYDVSMDIVRTRGASQAPASAAMRGNFRATVFLPSPRAIWLAPGTRLDLGGIAKGWIAEHAAQCLADDANACAVNAGGDLFAHGVPSEGAWKVALEDPQDPEKTLALLRVPQGAVATSSITKRRWKQGSVERHHLIDPRTGLPAATDWLSVTVIAPHAAVAEVFAKSLLIAGSRQAQEIASHRDDIEFIAVDQDGKLWGSPHAKEYLESKTQN